MKTFTSIFILLLFTTMLLAQPAGMLDPTFGNGGKVVTSITPGQDQAHSVAIQTNGKIVVAGSSTSTITGKDFAMIRYNTDGTLDNTFGNLGIVTTDVQLGSEDEAYSIAIQADGKIILAGYSDNGSNKDAALVRYKTDGSIDSTFGTNGKVLTNFEAAQQDQVSVVKVHLLTGNIIVGGATIISSSVSKPVVARYTSTGVLDSTFNNTGIKLLWVTSLDYQYLYNVEDLAVLPNGKISAVGWRDFPGLSWDSDYWVCRINSDGSMDNTFSGDGVAVYNGGFNGHDRAYSMLLLPSNNIMMAGGGYVDDLNYDFTMVEISSNGSLGTVQATTKFGGVFSDDVAYGLAQDNNGRFVLGGSSGGGTSRSFALARFNANGSVDATFGTSGKVTTTFGVNALNECGHIAIQSDNKIIAVGYTGGDFAVARYTGEAVPQLNVFQLVSPANGAINQSFSSLALDWTDAFGATGYELQVDVSPSFTSSPQTYSTTNSNRTLTNLLPGTTYYWRVRATDGNSFGNYTAIWEFSTGSLDDFSLLSPANNSTGHPLNILTLSWSTAQGASGYDLNVSTTSDFSANVSQHQVGGTSYNVTNLTQNQTYYWRVRSKQGNVIGNWLPTWQFTTKTLTTSLANEIVGDKIRIFPNPGSGLYQLKFTNEFLGQNFQILNQSGQVVKDGVVGQTQFQLDLSYLAAGMYFLSINQSSNTLKFVKQ